jgi:hypothetical protein
MAESLGSIQKHTDE